MHKRIVQFFMNGSILNQDIARYITCILDRIRILKVHRKKFDALYNNKEQKKRVKVLTYRYTLILTMTIKWFQLYNRLIVLIFF